MDALDLLLQEAKPLAIETVRGEVARLHYCDRGCARQGVLEALERSRVEAGFDTAVYLNFLAQPDRGELGWCRLCDLRF